MNDGNGWEHIIDLLILLNADEELINKIKQSFNKEIEVE